ncbi:MAG: ABC transporter permease [bacterium]
MTINNEKKEEINVETIEKKEEINVFDSRVVVEEESNFCKKIINNIVFFCKNSTLRYILSRVGSGLITLLFIITAVFLLLRMIPKDGYYNQGAMDKMTAIQQENYKKQIDAKYGFDKPVIIQLGTYIWNILPVPKVVPAREGFDDDYNIVVRETKVVFIYFGESLIVEPGEDIVDLLLERCPVSFQLGIIGLLLSWCIGYPVGVLMAKNKGKLFDKLGNAYIVMNLAIPGLVFYFIVKVVALKIGLPYFFEQNNFLTWVTPLFAMVALSFSGEMLWVRRFMVDEANADYVKFARSKGLSENRTMFTHVLRNAIVPLVRNLPGAVIGAIIGSYYIERTWGIPGSGSLLISAMDQIKPDNTLVQGLVIVYASISMIAFILGDIITVFFDPRIKLRK